MKIKFIITERHDVNFFPWVKDYDTYEEAEKAIEALKYKGVFKIEKIFIKD